MSKPSINYLQATNFRVSIQRLPHSTFHAQRANIPSIQGMEVVVPTYLNTTKQIYDKVIYNDFTFSFIVDEEMKNYTEIFNWMHGAGFPQTFEQYKELNEDPSKQHKSDLSLIILNNNKKPIKEFIFVGAFPIVLTDVMFDTTVSYTQYLEASATFTYDYFKINSLI